MRLRETTRRPRGRLRKSILPNGAQWRVESRSLTPVSYVAPGAAMPLATCIAFRRVEIRRVGDQAFRCELPDIATHSWLSANTGALSCSRRTGCRPLRSSGVVDIIRHLSGPASTWESRVLSAQRARSRDARATQTPARSSCAYFAGPRSHDSVSACDRLSTPVI